MTKFTEVLIYFLHNEKKNNRKDSLARIIARNYTLKKSVLEFQKLCKKKKNIHKTFLLQSRNHLIVTNSCACY